MEALIYSVLAEDPDLIELVEMFVDEIPDKIAVFEAACKTKDWDKLRIVSHQMKGAAGSYGFRPLSEEAAILEKCLKDAVTDENLIIEKVNSLVNVCRRAAVKPD